MPLLPLHHPLPLTALCHASARLLHAGDDALIAIVSRIDDKAYARRHLASITFHIVYSDGEWLPHPIWRNVTVDKRRIRKLRATGGKTREAL